MNTRKLKETLAEPDRPSASVCPKCGCRTVTGERYCPRCRARLSYSCPYCDAPEIDNTFVNCPSCRRPLTWATHTRVIVKPKTNESIVRKQISTINPSKEIEADERSKRPSLLGFLVALGLLALIVVAIVLAIQNM